MISTRCLSGLRAVRVDEVQSGGAGDVLKRDRRGRRPWRRRRRPLLTLTRDENASQHESECQYSAFHEASLARTQLPKLLLPQLPVHRALPLGRFAITKLLMFFRNRTVELESST